MGRRRHAGLFARDARIRELAAGRPHLRLTDIAERIQVEFDQVLTRARIQQIIERDGLRRRFCATRRAETARRRARRRATLLQAWRRTPAGRLITGFAARVPGVVVVVTADYTVKATLDGWLIRTHFPQINSKTTPWGAFYWRVNSAAAHAVHLVAVPDGRRLAYRTERDAVLYVRVNPEVSPRMRGWAEACRRHRPFLEWGGAEHRAERAA